MAIRGIRQSIPSGYVIGRQSPGSSKGAPGLIPLPPLNQQAVIAGSGGKATQGSGQGGAGSSSAAIVTVTAGTGISVTGAPAYTVALQVPVTVADGGTGTTLVGQLPATATNDNAAAGKLGEYISSIVLLAGEININSAANITSINLTAGDWDVWGEAWFDNLTGSATVNGAVKFAVTPASAAIPATPADNSSKMSIDAAILVAATGTANSLAPCRASLASTTPYYLVGAAAVSAGTAFAYGKLCARRAR